MHFSAASRCGFDGQLPTSPGLGLTARAPAAALVVFLAMLFPAVCASSDLPYPRSTLIERMVWHWDTHTVAAPGSDLWPVTWGPDGDMYTAWGDGGGFGGSDREGRVSLG